MGHKRIRKKKRTVDMFLTKDGINYSAQDMNSTTVVDKSRKDSVAAAEQRKSLIDSFEQ